MGSEFKVGSHHYVEYLSNYNDVSVFHLSTPVSIFHLLNRSGRKKLFYSLFKKKKVDIVPFFVFPIGKFCFIDFNKFIIWVNKTILKIVVRRKTKIKLDYFDIVVIDQPYYIPYIPQGAKIFYRPTDIISDMVGISVLAYESLLKNKISGVIATSRPVYDFYNLFFEMPSIILLENGVPDHFFSNYASKLSSNRAGALYVGSFDYRFDLEVCIYLANSNSNIGIDLYGPLPTNLIKGKHIPKNLNFKGEIKYENLPILLSKYCVGLMPFNSHPSNEGRSPMKIYEYLSCGLNVVSKSTDELVRRNIDGVFLYTNYKQADTLFKMAISMENNLNSSILDYRWSILTKKMFDFLLDESME